MLKNLSRASRKAQEHKLTQGSAIKGDFAAALQKGIAAGEEYNMESLHARSMNKRTIKAALKQTTLKQKKVVEELKEEEPLPRYAHDSAAGAVLKAQILAEGSFPEEFERKMIKPFFGGTTWATIKHAFWALYEESGLPELSQGDKINIQKKIQDRLNYGLRGKGMGPPEDTLMDPAVIDNHQWVKLLKVFNDITDQLLSQRGTATLHDAIVGFLRVPMTRHLHPLIALSSQQLRGHFNTRVSRHNQRKKKDEATANRLWGTGKYGDHISKVQRTQKAQKAQFEQEYQIKTQTLSLGDQSTQESSIKQKHSKTQDQKDFIFRTTPSIIEQLVPIGDKRVKTINLIDDQNKKQVFNFYEDSFYFKESEKKLKDIFAANKVPLRKMEQDYDSGDEDVQDGIEKQQKELGAAIHLFSQNDLYRATQLAAAEGERVPFSDYAMFQKFQARTILRDKSRVEMWKSCLNPQ